MTLSNAANEVVKFAYWVPNVSGGLVISNIEQRTSWTIEYNRKLAQIAEARRGAAEPSGAGPGSGRCTSLSKSGVPRIAASLPIRSGWR